MQESAGDFGFHFLGAFDVTFAGHAVRGFRTDKERALLAYLALEGSQPINRHLLAGMLWPETSESNANSNLRQTLFRLRRTLDAAVPGGSELVLGVTRHSLWFSAPNATVDLLDFGDQIAAFREHQHARLAACTSCRFRLTNAAQLYRGDFLAGFGIPDVPRFEEWLLLKREMAHLQEIQTLTALAVAYEGIGDLRRARYYAAHLVAQDTYREQSHRLLMRILARQGFPEKALAQYGICRRLLRDELDVEPDPETIALVESIRRGGFRTRDDQGDVQKTVDTVPADASPPILEGHALAKNADETLRDVPLARPFFGRQAEQAKVSRWLRRDGPSAESSVIAILGTGGVGKTALATQCVRSTVHQNPGEFDLVLWRSLRNSPSLSVVLPRILQILSGELVVDVPDALEEQLRVLTGFMRERRVLLVLDNLESIFDEKEAGQFRRGYEPYRQLIEWIATHSHHSILLFASRERPVGYALLEGDHPRVHSLRLSGLDETAGRALLAHKGIRALPMRGPRDDSAELVRRYSGNPMALKLAAETIEAVFGGEVAEFLDEQSLFFDDVRAVLDGQFARLSQLEQDILFWLAAERRAVTVSEMRRNFSASLSRRVLVEALRSLQRRSLLERVDTGYMLQHMFIEYLNERLVALPAVN